MKFFFNCLFIFIASAVLAQADLSSANDAEFEVLYDEPYNVNKLFIGFQPFYGELFATNVNAGFGLDAHYYLSNKADFRAHIRKTYTRKYFDQTRENATRNSDVQNPSEAFNYYEFGMTWHIKDFEEQSKTKIVLYKKTFTRSGK